MTPEEQREINRQQWLLTYPNWPGSEVTVLEVISPNSIRIQAPAGTRFSFGDFMVSVDGCELYNQNSKSGGGIPLCNFVANNLVCVGDGSDVLQFACAFIDSGQYQNCVSLPVVGAKVDGGIPPGPPAPPKTDRWVVLVKGDPDSESWEI